MPSLTCMLRHSYLLPALDVHSINASPRGSVGFPESRCVVQASSSIRSHLAHQALAERRPQKEKNKKQLLKEPEELTRNTRAQWVREMGLVSLYVTVAVSWNY